MFSGACQPAGQELDAGEEEGSDPGRDRPVRASGECGASRRGSRGPHPALYAAGARRAWVGTTGRAPGT